MSRDKKIFKLLKRTNVETSFNQLINQVVSKMDGLGEVIKVTPIEEGYEDANFLLEMTTGKYVLKIFLKTRTEQNIKDYVKLIEESQRLGIPVAKLVEGSNGTLGFIESRLPVKFIVSEYFSGVNFEKITPSKEDIGIVAKYLALLNTLSFPIEEEYDSWGNKNLLKEYPSNSKLLSDEQLALIDPVVNEFKKIDLGNFSKSVIHGDMQRKHVLKGGDGNYLILDFGCMSYDAKIIDLSTYLAWFVLLGKNWDKRDKLMDLVFKVYKRYHNFNRRELEAVKPLVKASYASYFMKTAFLITSGDSSDETLSWYRQSKGMLELALNW